MKGTLLILILTMGFSFAKDEFVLGVSHRSNLINHLMKNYELYGGGYIRPVLDSDTETTVTIRMLFHHLIEMDTRNQRFTISVWIKETWTDEFLTWNSSDFGGIDSIHIPGSLIWRPDITLYSNVDPAFERYMPGNLALVFQDGFVEWLTPAVLTSSCRVHVKFFPFDTQVCEMKMASWSYTDKQIHMQADMGRLAKQDRYLENGVWDMISVKVRHQTTWYSCCPDDFSEVVYRLTFKRRAEFYVVHLILPVTFLSILSILVFYLPPDCGEKLTLSITNLLALVVFQQIIADIMPPSGEDSPIIDTFFLVMIVMVCLSVVCTVLVIHIGSSARPVPRCIRWLFLDVLPTIVCLRHLERSQILNLNVQKINPLEEGEHIVLQNGDEEQCEYRNEHTSRVTHNHQMPNRTSTTRSQSRACDSENSETKKRLEYVVKDIQEKKLTEAIRSDWHQVAVVVDRCLLIIFVVFSIVSTLTLAAALLSGINHSYLEEFVNSTELIVRQPN
ncbi:neuronal acetylcholine receptor subunit alpha-10-like [Amphiura filiformis]|uniref:neuronal acetylcholine receptor subunit alpha-10-like n=1 Tax=Amphiura filiformis TaxID=82378 RepID=UPI003B2169AB